MLDNTATAITNAEREKINCKSNLAASEIVNNIGVQSTSSNYYYPGAIFRFSSWERPILVPRKANGVSFPSGKKLKITIIILNIFIMKY